MMVMMMVIVVMIHQCHKVFVRHYTRDAKPISEVLEHPSCTVELLLLRAEWHTYLSSVLAALYTREPLVDARP